MAIERRRISPSSGDRSATFERYRTLVRSPQGRIFRPVAGKQVQLVLALARSLHCFLWSGLPSAITVAGPTLLERFAVLSSVHPDLTLELAASGFRFGGEHPDKCGPSGIVFSEQGFWLVANCGTGELFSLRGLGSEVGEPLTDDAGVVDLAVGPNGALFGSRATEIIELDPSTGATLRSVADGFSELAGLAFDIRAGKLVVADYRASSLYEIHPETGERFLRATGDLLGRPDGIVLDESGRVYVAGYGRKHVLVVESDGTISDLGSIPGGPDGVALGGAGGPFAGSVIVNQRDGQVVALGADASLTTLASGGTPGDLVAVDSEGYLYVTQYKEIVRIGPPWFAPQPWRTMPLPL